MKKYHFVVILRDENGDVDSHYGLVSGLIAIKYILRTIVKHGLSKHGEVSKKQRQELEKELA